MNTNSVNKYQQTAKTAAHAPLTEEELAQRQLTRDVMNRLDVKEVSASLAQGRQRFNEAHAAQGGGPRPAALIPHSEAIQAKMAAILLELRDNEESGTTRMSLIDRWLAEFGVSHGRAAAQNDDTAVKVEISNEARLAALQLREFDLTDSALKIDESFFSREAHEQRRADFAKSLESPLNIDPFDNEFQILGVTYNFNAGTLEHFITDALAGKARNASLVASELGQMIRSAANNNGATVEERAVNRETGLKHAEYIAKNCFDDPDEAKAFLDGIMKFYENDVMRDKGYIVIEGSDIAPFRSYTMPNAPKGHMSANAIAKHFGASDEVLNDPDKLLEFVANLHKNQATTPQEWKSDIVKSFDENAQRVADIISLIKASLNETDVANSLARLLKAF